METNSENKIHVLIVGAGSAGLLLAQVLKKAHISFSIFEADSSPYQRPLDWNFGVYWAQSRLADCLPDDLKDRLTSVRCDPNFQTSAENFLPTFNGATGEPLKRLPAPWSIRLQRRKLLRLLSEGIDVQFNKRLSQIDVDGDVGCVTASFEDGAQEKGNLLIGADGTKSIVRQFLLGVEEAALIPSPVVMSVVITTLSKEAAVKLTALHPIHSMVFHPKGLYTWQSIHDCSSPNPEEWTWFLIHTWREDTSSTWGTITSSNTSDEILAAMRERGELLGPPYNEVYANMVNVTKAWHSRLSSWPTKTWEGGGLVTLAGDAAHPMTFHRGQGFNNAVTDATEFANHLEAMTAQTPQELAKAVREYEKELWPRGAQAVRDSNENTEMVHNWDRLQNSPLFRSGLKKEVDK